MFFLLLFVKFSSLVLQLAPCRYWKTNPSPKDTTSENLD